MRRFLVFIPFLLLSFFPVFGQSASDQLSASISLFPSQEKTAEASSSDTLKKLKQKQLEILSIMSIEKQRPLHDDETAEQRRADFLKQKQAQLTEINLDIERLQELRSHQIGNTIRQFSWYLLVFIFIYFLRVISRSFLSRFAG